MIVIPNETTKSSNENNVMMLSYFILVIYPDTCFPTIEEYQNSISEQSKKELHKVVEEKLKRLVDLSLRYYSRDARKLKLYD